MALDPLDDYLERTFAEAYRREIEHEENVWRSLPFFAAILALLVAAIAAAGPKLAATSGPRSWIFGGMLAIAAVATLVALILLAKSVAAADFRVVASESGFLRYAELLRAQALAGAATPQEAAETAAIAAKRALLREYAAITERNRSLNHRRQTWRAKAALALLLAVLPVLALVALTLAP